MPRRHRNGPDCGATAVYWVIDNEARMTPKNIALEPELLEQVDRLAQEEGKTVDEVANELLGPLLEIRKQAETSDRRWQSLLSYGREQAEKLGIKSECPVTS